MDEIERMKDLLATFQSEIKLAGKKGDVAILINTKDLKFVRIENNLIVEVLQKVDLTEF